MKPIRHPTTNAMLVADDCFDLPAARGEDSWATYWKPTWRELLGLTFGKPIRLSLRSSGHPPVSIEVRND